MCKQDLLISYLYDDLDGAARADLERHLRACAECRGELDGMRAVRADLARVDIRLCPQRSRWRIVPCAAPALTRGECDAGSRVLRGLAATTAVLAGWRRPRPSASTARRGLIGAGTLRQGGLRIEAPAQGASVDG